MEYVSVFSSVACCDLFKTINDLKLIKVNTGIDMGWSADTWENWYDATLGVPIKTVGVNDTLYVMRIVLDTDMKQCVVLDKHVLVKCEKYPRERIVSSKSYFTRYYDSTFDGSTMFDRFIGAVILYKEMGTIAEYPMCIELFPIVKRTHALIFPDTVVEFNNDKITVRRGDVCCQILRTADDHKNQRVIYIHIVGRVDVVSNADEYIKHMKFQFPDSRERLIAELLSIQERVKYLQ